MMVDITI